MQSKKNNFISLEKSKKVLIVYYRLLKNDITFSVLIVLIGLFTRLLNVGLFMLIVKVFLSVIEPESSVDLVNGVLAKFGDYEVSSIVMLQFMLSTLSVLIFVQYVMSKFNLNLFLARRKKLMLLALDFPLSHHEEANLNICLDHLPQGYEAVLKCCEILLFYIILFLAIFTVSPFAAFLTIVIVPFLIVLLILKNRKEVHATTQLREVRRGVKKMDSDVDNVISLSAQQLNYMRSSVINSDFFGGIALVILMVVFLFGYNDQGVNSLAALAMIFAIRFAITYARELSLHAGRILQQRVMIDKVTNVDFL